MTNHYAALSLRRRIAEFFSLAASPGQYAYAPALVAAGALKHLGSLILMYWR